MLFVWAKQFIFAVLALCLTSHAIAGSPMKLIQKRDVVIVTQEIVKVVGYTSTIWVQQPPPPPSPSASHPPSSPVKIESSIPEQPTTEPTIQVPTPTLVVEVPESAPVEAVPTGSGTGGVVSGKATFYDAGLGSCGETHSNDDMICALSKLTMGLTAGPNPNLNPMCGTKIRVKSASNSNGVIVTIVDTCPGCLGPNDLDLSPAAFDQLGNQLDGVINVTWERL